MLTRVGFEHFGVDRIEIRVDPENERSEKVPRKLGFTQEATLRRRLPTKRGSDLRDVNVWTMFAAELASSPCVQYEYVAYDAPRPPAVARVRNEHGCSATAGGSRCDVRVTSRTRLGRERR